MPDDPRPPLGVIALLSSAAALALGTFYALGLLIVNLHLAKHGIYAVEFGRADYLLTGGVYATLVAVCYCGVAVILAAGRDALARMRERYYLLAILRFGSALAFCSLAACAVVLAVVCRRNVHHIISVLASSILPACFIAFARWDWRGILNRRDAELQFAAVALNVMMALLFIAGYADAAHPCVSAAYGGGCREVVEIITRPEASEVCKAAGVPSGPHHGFGPLSILTETGDYVYFCCPASNSVQTCLVLRLRKDAIIAVFNES